MNVLSLFDGMSCAQIALNRIGVEYNKYFASEVDKYAIKVTQANYPDTIQIGDIKHIYYKEHGQLVWGKRQSDELPRGYSDVKIDLLIGGSPCQGFSFAGKQLNFNDPRSKLFFEYVRILHSLKKSYPDMYFLLENVKMNKEFQDRISSILGVEPIEINSNLVSAQNRRRLYWTNIEGIVIPEGPGPQLKDILEPITISCPMGIRAKSKSIRVGGRKSPFYSKHEWDSPFIKTDKKFKAKPSQYKASCLTGGAHSGGNHSDMDMLLFRNMECRRYTPVECERLQTIPDNYSNHVSNTQRYKMIGNAMTVDVIGHILGFIPRKAPCGCLEENWSQEWCAVCQVITTFCNCNQYGTCQCS